MKSSVLITLVIYRAVIAAIGFGFAILGLRLLPSGPAKNQNEARQVRSAFLTTLRRLDPGYWFVIFGGAVVLVCLILGIWTVLDKPMTTVTDGVGNNSTEKLAQYPITSASLGIGMLVLTAVLAIVTVWYAWSNHRYVVLSHKQLQLKTDPHVVAFTRKRNLAGRPQLEIVVRNFGNGIATEVWFDRSQKVDPSVWNDFLNPSGSATPLSTTAIKHGISVLPPKMEVAIPWDPQGFALMPRMPQAKEPESDDGGFNSRPGMYIMCRCKGQGPGQSTVEPIECLLDPMVEIEYGPTTVN